jgi:tetratricopeptide (TPR) repeat protein
MLRESVRRALDANMPHDACRGRLNLGEGLASLDYYEEARATFDELHAYAARVSTALYAGSSLVELAQLDWITGRWSDSFARRRQILEWLEQAQSQAYLEVKASSLFGQQHNDLGQAEVAYQILSKTLAKVHSFNELQMAAFHLAELARALVGLGSPEEAIEIVRELVATIKRGGYESRFSTLPLLKACYLFIGHTHPGPINEVMAALLQIEHTNPQSHSKATVAALREGQGVALLRNAPHQAVEPLRQAASLWQTLGRPYDRIRALNSLGQALSQTENSREAQAAFAEAHRLIKLLVAQLEDAELKASFLNSRLVGHLAKS